MSTDMAEEEHKPETWRCPKCGNVIKTFVPLTTTPTCHNPAKHDRKKFDMEKIK
jgi:rubrerythrin